MAITPITESSTFKAWYEVTNEIIGNLNANVVINGGDVYGAFNIKSAANTYLSVANGLYVNSSAVAFTSNTTFGSNIVANSSVSNFTIGAANLVLAPTNGTRFDTLALLNANLTVNATFSVNGAASVNGTLTITGDPTITGNLTANGLLNTRQVVYASNGSVAANTLGATSYNDFDVAGLANCAILNLTPSGHTAITGIVAPATVGSAGGRVLHLQNLSDTYSINLYSANASSQLANRIKTPGDVTIEIAPGAALSLIYTKTNAQWRVLAPQLRASGAQSFDGDVTITGNLSITGAITGVTANVNLNPLYVDKTNTRVGVGTNAPSYPFHATVNAYFGANVTMAANLTTGQILASGNANFFSGGVIIGSSGNTIFAANTITANGTAVSTIRNLSGNTISAANTLSTANLSVSGHATFATIAGTGNTSLLNGAVLANSSGNTVTFANTITVNGTTNSYIYALRSAVIYSDGSAIISGAASVGTTLGVSGALTGYANSSIAGFNFYGNSSVQYLTAATGVFWIGHPVAHLSTSSFHGKTQFVGGDGGRCVLPVGTNYYAT